MARFNEILTGRHNRFFQKLFSMKGGPPVPQLSSELQANFDVEDSPIELRFLKGEYIYGLSLVGAVVAAQFSFMQLRNPLTSGVIAILERIYVFNTSGPQQYVIQFGQPGANDGNVGLTRSRDGRQLAKSSLIASTGNLGAGTQIGTTIAQLAVSGANVTERFPNFKEGSLVLTPGDEVRVITLIAATQGFYSLLWRGRLIEDSEKSGGCSMTSVLTWLISHVLWLTLRVLRGCSPAVHPPSVHVLRKGDYSVV